VNDIQHWERGVSSEYEQYDEQKPQDVQPDGCSVEGVTHILLLEVISLTDTGGCYSESSTLIEQKRRKKSGGIVVWHHLQSYSTGDSSVDDVLNYNSTNDVDWEEEKYHQNWDHDEFRRLC